MADHPTIEARIDAARTRLALNLGELKQRIASTRRLVSPVTYLKNRWLQVGLGLAVGYLVGRRRTPKLLTDGSATNEPETLLHATLRSTAMTLAAVIVRRVVKLDSNKSGTDDH